MEPLRSTDFVYPVFPLLVWIVDSEYFAHDAKNVANELLLVEVLSAGEVDTGFGPGSDQKFVFCTWKLRETTHHINYFAMTRKF